MNIIKRVLIDQKESLELELKNKRLIDRRVLPLYGKFMPSKIVKIISGPRRCGKSVLCLELLRNAEFAYINFDDENLIGLKAADFNKITELLYQVYPNPKYFFFDEIQNIEGWELFVNRLARGGINILLTGSNAHLLSRELATHLTGRHYSFELFPFSFSEYLLFNGLYFNKEDSLSTKNTARVKEELLRYLAIGGFPEALQEPDARKYLQTLYGSIITRDIVLRNNVRHVQSMREISHYLMSLFSSRITYGKIRNIFNIKSVHTIKNYISFMEESYLIFLVERFSFKRKERSIAPRKIYAIDTGLIHAVTGDCSNEKGRLLENSVAIELRRIKSLENDFEFFYWQDVKGREVDFVLRNNSKVTMLIQVSYDVSNIETKKREITSLLKASEILRCNALYIITSEYENTEKIEGKLINYVPLYKWLLFPGDYGI